MMFNNNKTKKKQKALVINVWMDRDLERTTWMDCDCGIFNNNKRGKALVINIWMDRGLEMTIWIDCGYGWAAGRFVSLVCRRVSFERR